MVFFSIAMALIFFCWYRKARQQDKKLFEQEVCQIKEGGQINSYAFIFEFLYLMLFICL
jgi:hypothetical protein